MANVRRILFGNKHFTSSTCGFGFVDSVHVPEVPIDEMHVRVRRVLSLFPGTTLELGPLVKDQPDDAKPDEAKDDASESTKKEEQKTNDPAPAEKPNDGDPDEKPEPVVEAEGKLDNGADVAALAKAAAEDEAAKAAADAPAEVLAADAPADAVVDLVEEPVVEDEAPKHEADADAE